MANARGVVARAARAAERARTMSGSLASSSRYCDHRPVKFIVRLQLVLVPKCATQTLLYCKAHRAARQLIK